MVFGQSRSKFFIYVKILGLAQVETIIVPPCTNRTSISIQTVDELTTCGDVNVCLRRWKLSKNHEVHLYF